MEAQQLSESPSDVQHDEGSRYDALDAIGQALKDVRKEYVDYRRQSGIEQEWDEDEEYYEGIDDENRGEMSSWSGSKPLGQAGPDPDRGKGAGSTVFLNITRPFVDAGSARVGDMLLPTDDKGWSIKPTPIPELAEIAEGKIPAAVRQQILESEHTAAKAQEAGVSVEEQAATEEERVVAEERAELDKANKRAQKAETRIQDWHVETQYANAVRQVIEDASKLGTGVLKGPVPTTRWTTAYVDGHIKLEEKVIPESIRVDPRNLFPDASCGESIHNGNGIFERDKISRKELRELKRTGKYLDEQIDRVLKEGPHTVTAYSEGANLNKTLELYEGRNKHTFEIWYYYGHLGAEELKAAGVEGLPDEMGHIPVHLEMVNNHVIKAVVSHLDTGEFPYDVFNWQRRSGHWQGIGIARQIRTPQRMVNGAGRMLMDNAGVAGGPMLIFREGAVLPADGVAEIKPFKIWFAGDEIEDVDKAFAFVQIPMYQQELMAIMSLGIDMAERVSGLPMLLQGMQEDTAQTLGETQIRNNNGSTVLRRIARLFDDLLTEPHIRRYYTYLLQYGPDDDEKGDFQIDAQGSSALLQRDLINQSILQLGQIVENPVYGLDPKKWAEEVLASQQLEKARFQFDNEEWRGILEGLKQMAQGGGGEDKLAQIQAKGEIDAMLKEMDQEHETAMAEFKGSMEAAFKQADRELEELKLLADDTMQDKDIKAKMAEVVMKLNAQIELATDKMYGAQRDSISAGGRTRPAPQVANPIAEPPGRADDGMAFQQ